MAKKEKYRAHCLDCDYRGSWTKDMEKAKQDARDHHTEKPDHDVDLEINQSFLTRLRDDE